MEGYMHPLYAQSFSEIGVPIFLPKSKGWLIKRRIPGTSYYDAMGPYPLFFCENWNELLDDFEALKDQLVSISLVIDPFSEIPYELFENFFDQFRAYKDYYLLDLSLSLNKVISKNKRRNAQRALRNLSVELIKSPNIHLEEWVSLYQHLITRHQIQGIRAFTKEAFEKQISVPNTHYFHVINHENGAVVGGNLFYIQRNVAYAHLSAFTKAGYETGAPYAVKWVAFDYLSNYVRWINLGGSTKNQNGGLDGLGQFKKGWSSSTEKSIFCGKIFNSKIYVDLTQNKKLQDVEWFPIYRSGEF